MTSTFALLETSTVGDAPVTVMASSSAPTSSVGVERADEVDAQLHLLLPRLLEAGSENVTV